MENKMQASVSLDLDDLWAYLKVYGDPSWRAFPSYLEIFLPAFLDFLDRERLSITFFIVGQDADIEKNRDFLQEITRRGHDVGNHSYRHEPWLAAYPLDELKQELLSAEEAIIRATGQKPLGFRGPGFAWSFSLLRLLAELGYVYDSTVLPTFIGPLARLYYRWKAPPSAKPDSLDRRQLFGSFQNGFWPLSPYKWQIASESSLLEIPVTTIPFCKLPFHMSYLTYLSAYSPSLRRLYFRIALQMCRWRSVSPHFLLHPTDFLGFDSAPALHFFPGMRLSTKEKEANLSETLATLKKNFQIVSLLTIAQNALSDPQTAKRSPEKGYEN